MAKVYVSSTYQDLKECRALVRQALQSIGLDDVAMETYTADSDRPVDKCLKDVAECDLYIGIFAWRYGFVPATHNRSITELEYRTACGNHKDCLVFLLHEDAAWPRSQVERGEGAARIEALRDELGRKHTCSFFHNPEELAKQVVTAVANWLAFRGAATAAIGGLSADVRLAYARRLQQRYGRLDLDALTPPQREEYLQIMLRSVFVEQNVREDLPPIELPKELWGRLQRRGEVQTADLPTGLDLEDYLRARKSYQARPAWPVLDVLTRAEGHQVVLLGDPGAGKSTLARYLALSLAGGDPDGQLGTLADHLPLLIELRAYVGARREHRCETFLEFLDYLSRTEELGLSYELLNAHLRDGGRAVVIFDGLDELFDPAERETVARQIAGFAARYRRVRVVVTSRIIGYHWAILGDAGFRHYTLQDLDDHQITAFIKRWYLLALHDRPGDAKQLQRRLRDSIHGSRSIRELAGNPMLLTILAIIGKHQELPRERWKLYDHAATVLIQHWDVNKHLRDLNVPADFIGEEDKKELLRRVAYQMQAGGGGLAGNYIPADQLQAEFEAYLVARYRRDPASAKMIAVAMIDQFRHRNFILSRYGADLYGFVHRAFLEYFCAAAFTWRFKETRELSIDQLKQEVFGRHWADESWREVLRLITGMLAPRFAGELIEFLAREAYRAWPLRIAEAPPRNLVLAVQCLAEVRNPTAIQQASASLLGAIVELLERSTRGVGNDYDDMLKNDYDDMLKKELVPAIEATAGSWPARDLYVRWYLHKGEQITGRTISRHAARIAVILAPDFDKLRAKLLKQVAHGHESVVRSAAMDALAYGWRDHPDTLPLLRDRAINDPSTNVRRTAISTIGDGWREHADILPFLRDRATNDPSNHVRSIAIGTIGIGWHSHPDTLPFLRRRATNDPDNLARSMAISMVGDGWREHPGTLPFLRDRATNDSDDFVRDTAISTIGTRWRDHPDILPLLRDRATNDPDDFVRATAIKMIGDGWREHADILPFLRDRATNDPSNHVRGIAVSLSKMESTE